MSDIADILGFSGKQDDSLKVASKASKPAKKPKGMSREVYDLIGAETLVPSMQPNAIAPTFKNKRATVLKGKWIWDVIKNSARQEHQLELHHWVKAEMTYTDYPYAKFNVKMEDFALSEEDYERHQLADAAWTYADTAALMATCVRYDLRWPVIHDKLCLSVFRRVEELQARYYAVVAKVSGEARPPQFNLEAEARRREQQDFLFRR